MIKNIVLSGGAYLGLIQFGVLNSLRINNFYNINNIQKVYGTSIGGFIGAMLCLKLDMDDLIENFTDRPWHNLLGLSPSILSDFYLKKGIVNKKICLRATSNLLESVDLTNDITLKEFYDYSKIELHLYTISLSDFKLNDISYKSHPNMLLVDAIYITCSIPYIFQPLEINGENYIDGGLLCNYPLNKCLEQDNNKDETLSLCFSYSENNLTEKESIQDKNLIEFCYYMHSKLLENKIESTERGLIKNEVVIDTNTSNISTAIDLVFNKELRKEYVLRGEEIGDKFIKDNS
jgi:predicted acylesterase/phospholipase RssA